MPREKAAIVMLRRKYGYSTNQLADAFTRSASQIHRILKVNQALGALHLKDLRRLPCRIKKLAAVRQRRQLRFYMGKWLGFILGVEDRPP